MRLKTFEQGYSGGGRRVGWSFSGEEFEIMIIPDNFSSKKWKYSILINERPAIWLNQDSSPEFETVREAYRAALKIVNRHKISFCKEYREALDILTEDNEWNNWNDGRDQYWAARYDCRIMPEGVRFAA